MRRHSFLRMQMFASRRFFRRFLFFFFPIEICDDDGRAHAHWIPNRAMGHGHHFGDNEPNIQMNDDLLIDSCAVVA